MAENKDLIEPVTEKLTKEVMDTLPSIREIIYAEFAEWGAMGNSGGLMLYIIKDNKLICYETNIREDEDLFYEVVSILEEHENSYENPEDEDSYENPGGIFLYYNGGVGNNVFISRKLEIGDGYFIYKKEQKDYCISSSVEGVFNRVVYEMQYEEEDEMPDFEEDDDEE